MSFNLKSRFGTQLEGSFFKKGHVFKNWRQRFFVLDMVEKTLNYYSDEEKVSNKGKLPSLALDCYSCLYLLTVTMLYDFSACDSF